MVNLSDRVNPYDPDLQPNKSEEWYASYYAQSKHAQWKPNKRGKKQPRIATLDAETDPFAGPGQFIKPFCWGFYDGSTFTVFWGDDSTEKLSRHIRSLDYPHIIYAHNGGKFDFTFLLDLIEPEVFTIGTRIVRAQVLSDDKKLTHELRDSFAVIPESLADAADKMKFDYDLMKRSKREKFRPQIIDYLKQDCIELYKALEVFRGELGDTLTLASGAMKKLNLAMKGKSRKSGRVLQCYERLTDYQDDELRPYYYGGHVQCFKRGIFDDGPYRLFDINSSYANVMRNYLHPISAGYIKGCKTITDKTDFCLIDATSQGALPLRNQKTKELLFPHGRFLFQATGHEVRMALKLGLIVIHKLHDAWEANERSSFAPFIDHYYRVRLEARARGDKMFALLWKRVMNGAYGKFAQDPKKFKDTMIVKPGDDAPDDDWTLSERYELYDIYQRPSDPSRAWRSYLNVGTGASITGAARAELMHGIHMAKDILYCDTDSILAKSLDLPLSGQTLGEWKIEAIGDRVAIGDKKIYAIWGEPENDIEAAEHIKDYGDSRCIKLASKGVRATANDVLKFAQGYEVEFVPLAPTFKIDGSQIWTSRKLKRRDMVIPENNHILSERSLLY